MKILFLVSSLLLSVSAYAMEPGDPIQGRALICLNQAALEPIFEMITKGEDLEKIKVAIAEEKDCAMLPIDGTAGVELKHGQDWSLWSMSVRGKIVYSVLRPSTGRDS